MSKAPKKPAHNKAVEALVYADCKRKNIPTAELQALARADEALRVAYKRRNRDLDPQLVWHGKDDHDPSDLVVIAPLLYIKEKLHLNAPTDDLLRQTREQQHETGEMMAL